MVPGNAAVSRWFQRDNSTPLDAAAFALDVAQISPVIESKLGYINDAIIDAANDKRLSDLEFVSMQNEKIDQTDPT